MTAGWAIHFGRGLKTFTFDKGRVAKLVQDLHGIVYPMVYEGEAMLDARSERNLQGVHTALDAVVRRAAEVMAERNDGLTFIVTCGVRTREQQAELVRVGASQTMNSKHL